MYTLTVKREFSAAHYLPFYDGDCQRMHGHTWVCEVKIQGPLRGGDSPLRGMIMDFRDVKLYLDRILGDHSVLNETMYINPTAENLSKIVFDDLNERMIKDLYPEIGVHLVSVTIWESDECGATYQPDEEVP